MMLSNQWSILCSQEVQRFIANHENDDVSRLLLKNRTLFGLPFSVIASQILSKRKIKDKAPLLYHTDGIIYPPTLNIEQSSSEETALFKTKFFYEEVFKKDIVDLSGGFGIDALFFAKAARSLQYVEPNDSLSKIVEHNFKVLKIQNVNFHCSTAEDFLRKQGNKADLIYVDPSRRDELKKKVFRLEDCIPRISEIKDLVFQKANHLLIKASPLLDISEALTKIPFVKKIVVVSVLNECKELLFLSEKDFNGTAEIHAVNLLNEKHQSFIFNEDDERRALSTIGEPLNFLYEPNSSILKAGAFKIVSERFKLLKLHANTHFYTSAKLVNDFPGRVFEIQNANPNAKGLVGMKANVICRNYPLKADELSKKFRLKDGGDQYLLAFSSTKRKHLVLASRVA